MHHNLKLTLAQSGLVHTVFGNIVKLQQSSVLQSNQHTNLISPVGTQETAANWNFVFHIAAISAFVLSFQVAAPEPGIKDEPDAQGYSAQRKTKNTV